MILYLDTSLLVTALTKEERTTRTRDWLNEKSAEELVVSDWVVAEFSSALSVKLRARDIDEDYRARAFSAFRLMCRENVEVLPVSSRHFRAAAGVADQYAMGIRAGDALPIAICADHGATLCTLDRRLREASPSFGVGVISP